MGFDSLSVNWAMIEITRIRSLGLAGVTVGFRVKARFRVSNFNNITPACCIYYQFIPTYFGALGEKCWIMESVMWGVKRKFHG